MFWTKILFLLMAVLAAWQSYRYVRANPEALSAANLTKSFFGLGVLAVFLIVFVAVCVMFLKN